MADKQPTHAEERAGKFAKKFMRDYGGSLATNSAPTPATDMPGMIANIQKARQKIRKIRRPAAE